MPGGRSINLALSARGLAALREVGLESVVTAAAIPMHGRMLHARDGSLTYVPYGQTGQFIYSISRPARLCSDQPSVINPRFIP